MSVKKALWSLFSLLTMLVAIPVFIVLILVGTSWGSAWTLGMVTDWLRGNQGIDVTWTEIDGDLVSGLDVSELRVVQQGEESSLEFVTGELELRWLALALLHRNVHVTRLQLGDTRLTLAGGGESPEEPADPEAIIRSLFRLPVSIEIDHLGVENFTLVTGAGTQQFQVGEFSASLDDRELLVERLAGSWQALELSVDMLRLEQGFGVSGDLAWGYSLEDMDFEGRASLDGSLDRLGITHDLLVPHDVHSDGVVTGLPGTEIGFDISHDTRGYPGFLPEVPGLGDLELRLVTRGTPANVELDAQADYTLEPLGPLNTAISATYSGNALTIERLEATGDDVRLGVSGRVDLQQPLSGEFEWQLAAGQIPQLPLELSFTDVQADGSTDFSLPEGGGPVVDIDIAQLDGVLNDYALSLQASGRINGQKVEALSLDLTQAENALHLEGELGEQFDLVFDADLAALQALLPRLSGSLDASGEIAGTREAPSLTLDGQADTLVWGEGDSALRLEQATLSGSLSQSSSALDLNLSGFTAGEGLPDVQSASLDFDGTIDAHTLQLNVLSDQRRITLAGQGGWQNQQWQGSIDTALADTEYGMWNLEQPIALTASGSAASVQQHCWAMTGTALGLCLEADWNGGSDVEAGLALSGVPLDWFTREQTLENIFRPDLQASLDARPAGVQQLQTDYGIFLPNRSFIEGSANLRLGIEPAADADAGLVFSFALEPGSAEVGLVSLPEDESQSMAPQVDTYNLDYRQLEAVYGGKAWEFLADLGIARDTGDFLLSGSLVADVQLDGDGALGGSIDIDFPTLDWLESMVPRLSDPRGSLRGNIGLGGDLERPLIRSDLELSDASVGVPETGLSLSDIDLSLDSDDSNHFRFSGGVTSGEGRLSFTGEMNTPFLPERNMQLSLEGERVEVLALPDRYVALSPDLDLRLDSEAFRIEGDLVVPVFRLALTDLDLGSSKVDVSHDVYIKRPPTENQEDMPVAEQVQSLPVEARITVTLGEEVRFTGYGLELDLGGQITIEQDDSRPFQAYGEVNVEQGHYEMYGQRLNVETGNLFFIGNPANPALDIRATRQVDDITTGVHIGGTLSDMRSQLFSSPVLPESEVLAMLITGKNFNKVNESEGNSMLAAIANLGIERGQGITNSVQDALGLDSVTVTPANDLRDSSLGIGKYLTPDLFMEYKVGLADKRGILSIDYRLTDRLKLEVESGISQSIDLTYTVEK